MLIFDIETDGFLEELTKIHCIVTFNTHDKLYRRYNDITGAASVGTIADGVKELAVSESICGHNIMEFDVPAIQKVYPDFKPKKVIDTLIISRLIWTNIRDIDFRLIAKNKLPEIYKKKGLIGSHSLKAWGYRVGVLKDEFGDTADWSVWTPDMEDYCEQDVVVNVALWEKIVNKNYSQEAIELEHRVREIVIRQERFGFKFDEKKAGELYSKLVKRREELEVKLQAFFPPWTVDLGEFIPKANNKRYGYIKGVPVQKTKTLIFNPGSRDHIADRLKTIYKWKPKSFCDSGKPTVDESVLKKLKYEPCVYLVEYLTIQKRLGQLAEGRQAWLKLVRNGRIHGRVQTNGAVTGRMTHSNPNVAQVPACRAAYGQECRELWTVDEGFELVGADASGLELRCLAHYMAKWDKGKYAKIILESDIHTANQKAAGLPTRDQAKTFIYALCYGAGEAKIGEIIGKGYIEGKRMKQRFFRNIPALGKLTEAVKKAAKRGYLKGLDGRQLHVRSEHAALNTLLQSAGALIMKKALVLAYEEMEMRGHVAGVDFEEVGNIHDEFQWQVRSELAEEAGQIMVAAMVAAGKSFNFRCPVDGEFSVGKSWAETH